MKSCQFFKALLFALTLALIAKGADGKLRDRDCSRKLTQLEITKQAERIKQLEEENLKMAQESILNHGVFNDVINYSGVKAPYLSQNVFSVTPPGCTAEQIWILGRHGTSYPTKGEVLIMQTNLPALQEIIRINSEKVSSTAVSPVVDAILKWKPHPNLSTVDQSLLTEQGYKEWREIAKRLHKRFPNLFPPVFNKDKYYIRGTGDQNSQESAKAFARAIFNESCPNEALAPPAEIGDPILSYYETCEKWTKLDAYKNLDLAKEFLTFAQTPSYVQALQKLSERLGLSSRTLAHQEVLYIFHACAFESAWNLTAQSPWCAIFDQDTFEVIEYALDLRNYYLDGYANTISYEQACAPLKDVVQKFTAKIQSKTNDNIRGEALLTSAYFGSSETILKFFARLGLFKDTENLRSDTYSKFKHGVRQWQTSNIGKFASNIAFVLFSCSSESNSAEIVYKIGTLVQEQPIGLLACDGSWICPFRDFVKNVADTVNTCDLDEICKI